MKKIKIKHQKYMIKKLKQLIIFFMFLSITLKTLD
jgi:hypothetical protein